MRRIEDYLIPLPKKIEQSEKSFVLAHFAGSVAVRLSEKCDLTRSARDVLTKKLGALAAVTTDGKRGDYKILSKRKQD